MHVKLTNGHPEIYTIGKLRRDNPNTSFPKDIPDEILASYDVYPMVTTERLKVDHTKNTSIGVPTLVDGVYTQTWDVTDASLEEIRVRVNEKSQSVRSQRDNLLASTDWLVIKAQETGAAMDQAWATYRQALRDITVHPNFPYLLDDDWPVKPD